MTITVGKKTLLTLVAAAAIAAAGGAYATWSTSGSGDGYAKATTASAITLADASSSTSGDLYPGGSGNLKLKVSNPNSFPVRITAVAGSGTIGSDTVGCTSANHAVTFTDQTSQTLDLTANASNTVFTLTGVVHMGSSAANACQGAVFTVPVTLTATSN
jgi:hypothetical protein